MNFSIVVVGILAVAFLEAFHFILQGEMEKRRDRRRINVEKADFGGHERTR